jgi:hypothetical protein
MVFPKRLFLPTHPGARRGLEEVWKRSRRGLEEVEKRFGRGREEAIGVGRKRRFGNTMAPSPPAFADAIAPACICQERRIKQTLRLLMLIQERYVKQVQKKHHNAHLKTRCLAINSPGPIMNL